MGLGLLADTAKISIINSLVQFIRLVANFDNNVVGGAAPGWKLTWSSRIRSKHDWVKQHICMGNEAEPQPDCEVVI